MLSDKLRLGPMLLDPQVPRLQSRACSKRPGALRGGVVRRRVAIACSARHKHFGVVFTCASICLVQSARLNQCFSEKGTFIMNPRRLVFAKATLPKSSITKAAPWRRTPTFCLELLKAPSVRSQDIRILVYVLTEQPFRSQQCGGALRSRRFRDRCWRRLLVGASQAGAAILHRVVSLLPLLVGAAGCCPAFHRRHHTALCFA